MDVLFMEPRVHSSTMDGEFVSIAPGDCHPWQLDSVLWFVNGASLHHSSRFLQE